MIIAYVRAHGRFVTVFLQYYTLHISFYTFTHITYAFVKLINILNYFAVVDGSYTPVTPEARYHCGACTA